MKSLTCPPILIFDSACYDFVVLKFLVFKGSNK